MLPLLLAFLTFTFYLTTSTICLKTIHTGRRRWRGRAAGNLLSFIKMFFFSSSKYNFPAFFRTYFIYYHFSVCLFFYGCENGSALACHPLHGGHWKATWLFVLDELQSFYFLDFVVFWRSCLVVLTLFQRQQECL